MDLGSEQSWFLGTLCGLGSEGNVKDEVDHRSYEIDTSDGTYRRNRRDSVVSRATRRCAHRFDGGENSSVTQE